MAAPSAPAARRAALDIYFVDVEGGQSTLIVTPAGKTLLVDSGFPGTGAFDAVPGDPRRARDANRIVAAARRAGVKRIDYLLVTHFHADHVGGIPELAQLMPIGTFVDHETVPGNADDGAVGTLAAFERYEKIRARAHHVAATIGGRIPLTGVEIEIVSSAGMTLARPVAAAGMPNAACGSGPVAAKESIENPRSTGIRLVFGRFSFLDLGDLTGAPLHALSCPTDMIGAVDVYLVAHHGGADAADPATLAAFQPQVAIVNNGAQKGGAPQLLALLRTAGVDTFQLHRSIAAGAANAEDARVANLDESTAHWIELMAERDGSFTVTNGRTGAMTRYMSRTPTGADARPRR